MIRSGHHGAPILSLMVGLLATGPVVAQNRNQTPFKTEPFPAAGPNRWPPTPAAETDATPQPATPRRPSGDAATVSLRRISHKPPGAARKAFEKGTRSLSAGRSTEAVELFRHATGIDPDYSDAYTGLGTALSALEDYAGAIRAFQDAIRTDPGSAFAYCQLSGAYALVNNHEASEQNARKALALDPAMEKARYFLTMALVAQKKFTDETASNLKLAAREWPRAHLLAAHVLTQLGRDEEARLELEKYKESQTR